MVGRPRGVVGRRELFTLRCSRLTGRHARTLSCPCGEGQAKTMCRHHIAVAAESDARATTGAACSPAPSALVRPRPNLLVELLQPVGGEVARLADADDLALVGLDLGHRLRHLAG